MKLPGTLDTVIPAFLDVAINRLNSEVKTSALKVVLVEVVSIVQCVELDPVLCFEPKHDFEFNTFFEC